MGDCFLLYALKGDITGIWFLREDASAYQADFNILEKRFPHSYFLSKENESIPEIIPPEYYWTELKGSAEPEDYYSPIAGKKAPGSDIKEDEKLIRDSLSALFKKLKEFESFSIRQGSVATGENGGMTFIM